jgi:hypothetical protein
MPVTHVTYRNETLSIEDATQRFREGHIDWPFPFAYVKTAIRQSQPRNFVSPSQLKSCPRQFVLKQVEDYAVELEGISAAVKGTEFHNVMQRSLEDEPGFITEERVTRTLALIVDGEPFELALSGQPDMVTPFGAIEDYKTTGGYMKKDFNGYDSHKLQLQVYGWILRPTRPYVRLARLFYHGNKQQVKIEFELWDDAQVEAQIAHYATEYVRWMRDNSYLPPVPEDPEMLRFCETCPVRMACNAYDEMGVTHL